jgi:hypothetical protein
METGRQPLLQRVSWKFATGWCWLKEKIGSFDLQEDFLPILPILPTKSIIIFMPHNHHNHHYQIVPVGAVFLA